MRQETAMAAAGQKALVAGYLDTANAATLSLFGALEEAVNDDQFDTLSVAQEELQAAFNDSITKYA